MNIWILIFLVFIIFSFIIFFAVKILAKMQLNKLRRNYNATEDKSRKRDNEGIVIDIARTNGIIKPNTDIEGNAELEGRSLLQDEPIASIGGHIPSPAESSEGTGENKQRIEPVEPRGKAKWNRLIKKKKSQ